MSDARLGMVQINVTDLLEAWGFYVERLGIPGEWALGHGRPFSLALAPIPVLVYQVAESRPDQYPTITGTILVFHTDDLAATIETWRSRGVEFVPIAWSTNETGVAPTPFGDFIAFRDPFGNTHELLEPK